MEAYSRRPERPFAAHWFDIGMKLFAVGIFASIATIALATLPQMRVIGAITLACAALGMLVSVIGVKLYYPSRWRSLRAYATSIGESMHGASEAIGEPRRGGYPAALATADAGARPTVAWPSRLRG
jgi:hypothetical protein